MKPLHEHLLRPHPNRESVEELCCLFVLGDLSQEDRCLLEDHLKECEECRDQVKGFERIALFDLPAVASLRKEKLVPESLEFTNEVRIRARVLERAKVVLGRNEGQNQITHEIVSPCPTPWLRLVRRGARNAVPAAGWAIAAALLLGFVWKSGPMSGGSALATAPVAVPAQSTNALNSLKDRASIAEMQRDQVLEKLAEAEALNRNSLWNLSQMTSQYDGLSASYSELKGEKALEEDQLKQRAAELELTRKDLKEQIAAKESLQGQLSEVSERLDRNSAEVARLENVAVTTPVRLPVSEKELDGNEAREILGARELHLVDVFDVDNAGKSSRAYGRVYYVNHDLLVFYAFDLSKLERTHKAVAFQAWGFRQPQSTKAESLGLFYMDNATLNRWTLRVSDPQLLSRIDTMFVTVEPPGGSRFPKGRRLLMASLAGPANHP